MAAPLEVTTLALSGSFVMNKNLSDNPDKILERQGVEWFTRKAIGIATITLHVKHYKDDNGTEHIDIQQIFMGGIEGTQENRTLDWTARCHEDKIFGQCIGKSHRIKIEEVEDEFLKQGWLPEVHDTGVIQSWVTSDSSKSRLKWTAHQIWGFEEINNERRYVRHLDFKAQEGNKEEKIQVKLIYDYVGQLQEE